MVRWSFSNIQCQLLQFGSMSPALAQSPRTEGDQNSNGKHPSIALCLGGGTVEERADTGILVVNEVPVDEGLA